MVNWKEIEFKRFLSIIRNVKCPKCNTLMVLRKTKKGSFSGSKFFGCGNYPKCDGTLPISADNDPYKNLSYESLILNENKKNKEKEELVKEIEDKKRSLQHKKQELDSKEQQINNSISKIHNDISLTRKDSSFLGGILPTLTSIGLTVYLIIKLPFDMNFDGFEYIVYLIIFGFIYSITNSIFSFILGTDRDAENFDKIVEQKTQKFKVELKKIPIEKNILQNETNEIESLRKKIGLCDLTIEYINKLKPKIRERERSAKISAYEDKARTGTQSIKEQLLKITKNQFDCPYCLKTIFKDLAEADHIHPISKGGLTTIQNIVLICKSCNSKKSNNTLRIFCKKQSFDYLEICERLELLGKDV